MKHFALLVRLIISLGFSISSFSFYSSGLKIFPDKSRSVPLFTRFALRNQEGSFSPRPKVAPAKWRTVISYRFVKMACAGGLRGGLRVTRGGEGGRSLRAAQRAASLAPARAVTTATH